MTYTVAATPKLDLSRVISRSFAVIGQRWRPLGFFLLVYLAFDWADIFVHPANYKPGSHDVPRFVLMGAISIAFICLRWARNSALTAIALPSTPSTSSISFALGQALRALPTLLLFALLAVVPELVPGLWRTWSGFGGRGQPVLYFSLLVSVGTFIWDLIVTLGWGLIVPVVVAEQEGLVASLGRAWRLLSGNRWRFLGLYIAVLVAGAVPAMIGTAWVLAISRSMAIHGAVSVPASFQVERAVTGALGAVVTAVWEIMIAMAYLELRRAKEGIALGDVAEVFA